jgi:hypothetical protein
MICVNYHWFYSALKRMFPESLLKRPNDRVTDIKKTSGVNATTNMSTNSPPARSSPDAGLITVK